jgi:hypothetical protein
VCLPTLRESDAAVENLNVLHMGMNGLVAFDGGDEPFLKPSLSVDGKAFPWGGRLAWTREADWLPRFSASDDELEVEGCWFCPPGVRGAVFTLKVVNHSIRRVRVEVSLEACWNRVLHSINETKELEGGRFLVPGGWDGFPVLEFRAPEPRLAFALYSGERGLQTSCRADGREPRHRSGTTDARKGLPCGRANIRLAVPKELSPNESTRVFFFAGLALDEVGAVTEGREMNRVGGSTLKEQTLRWLEERRRTLAEDPGGRLTRLMNVNAFFNRFFATGLTLDGEEPAALTSRSPRYYVSGAYWDRDALLWSFPSILALDPAWARALLLAVFARQGRNFGVHSRYLNGSVLEPGFELDELCAPVIALRSLVEATGDRRLLSEKAVLDGLDVFRSRLADHQHPELPLYRTWLLPSDDPWPQRYVTYDNVLVWRALLDLAMLSEVRGAPGGREAAAALRKEAEAVRAAVRTRCTVEGKGGAMFAWSVDLEGAHLLYDDPPGSLLLLPHYGFCTLDDPVWRRTKEWVHSGDHRYSFKGKPFCEVGCAHAEHPWVLSAVNSLLAGETRRAVDFLSRAPMDNGIACESVDEETGEAASGEAFATCAGFLAYGLWKVLGPGRDAEPGPAAERRTGDA